MGYTPSYGYLNRENYDPMDLGVPQFQTMKSSGYCVPDQNQRYSKSQKKDFGGGLADDDLLAWLQYLFFATQKLIWPRDHVARARQMSIVVSMSSSRRKAGQGMPIANNRYQLISTIYSCKSKYTARSIPPIHTPDPYPDPYQNTGDPQVWIMVERSILPIPIF